MKTSIAFVVFFLGALFITNVLNAQSYSIVENENYTARFTQFQGSTKIRVMVVKPAGTNFWLTVRDSTHYPVCYLHMSRRETQRFFIVDMDAMPDGKYVFELESGKASLTAKLPIVSKTVIKEKAILAQPIVGERFVFTN